MTKAWVGLTLLACLLAVAAGGLASDGEAAVHPLTTADEGEVPADVPVTLGWVLTNDEGQPAFHQDAAFEVTHEGRTLLATTPASGHDYDGVDPYQVAFPEPGNFTVTARVHDDGDVRELTYEGTVTPAPEGELDVALEAPEQVAAGQLADIGADVTGPEGESREDVEVTLRVQRVGDRFEVLKTRLAGEEPTLSYALERTGTFRIVAVASPVPGGDASDLGAASTTTQLTVTPGSPAAPGAPIEPPLVNDRETGERGDGYELFATYDPYTSVGPHGRLRLGLLTLDAASHAPASDVHYRVSVLDPEDDLVLQTADLVAADGFEYVTLSRPQVGTYTARIHAQAGGWSDTTTAEFTVQAPVGATNAGPLFTSPNASTTLEAGQAQTFPVHAEDAAGVPLTHGEVDVRWLDGDDVPLATGKLHVHENGTMPVTLGAHETGEHTLELLGQSLQPAPTPRTYGEQVGQPPVFAVDVAEAGAVDDEPIDLQEADDREIGWPGALGLAAALGTGLALSARRSR